MNGDNMKKFKEAYRPEDYTHGPVRKYFQYEIDEWEATSGRDCRRKVDNQRGLHYSDIVYLDKVAAKQAEDLWQAITDPKPEVDLSDSTTHADDAEYSGNE